MDEVSHSSKNLGQETLHTVIKWCPRWYRNVLNFYYCNSYQW